VTDSENLWENVFRYDNRPFTQVMSRDELGYGKYYFDDSLGLLWVHVENPQRGYDIFYGAAYQSAYFPIRVTAWCPGGNCTGSLSIFSFLFNRVYFL
jgi:hypothetical protein